MTKKIDWLDGGAEPKCEPNPNFPNGRDIDVSGGSKPSCTVALPYPAKRIGIYTITCVECGLKIGVTTAGRPDDPKSATFRCKVATRH